MTGKKDAAYDLCCLGILVLDVFGKTINHFPEKGTAGYFDTLKICAGGCAYNTGVDAARLGLRVSVQGRVGFDQFGDILIRKLKEEKVDVAGVNRSDKTNTAFSFIMVPEDGQRRIYHNLGVNRTYKAADVSKDIIKRSRVFHMAGASLLPAMDGKPTFELLQFAQGKGVLTSLDPVVRQGIRKLILPCLPYLDLFLPNNDESVHITGLTDPEEQLKFYLDNGAKIVGIKMGEKGVLISNGKDFFKFGIYKVPVVDTCGAGDAFIAGFIYGLLQKWDLLKIAKFASAMAAFCVQAIGATNAIPNAQNILDFMQERVIECR